MAYMINGDDTVLDASVSTGTFSECLQRADITGSFDDHRFCTANGRQVLLGHHEIAPVQTGRTVDVIQHSRAGARDCTAVNTVS